MSGERLTTTEQTFEGLVAHHREAVRELGEAQAQKREADRELIEWINNSNEVFDITGYPGSRVTVWPGEAGSPPRSVAVPCYSLLEDKEREPRTFSDYRLRGNADRGVVTLQILEHDSPSYWLMSLDAVRSITIHVPESIEV